jgi:hypothetical protein
LSLFGKYWFGITNSILLLIGHRRSIFFTIRSRLRWC